MKKFLSAILIVGFLFTGCGSEDPKPKPATEVQKPVTETTTPVEKIEKPVEQVNKVTNLGMTFEQFKSNYNAFLNELGLQILNIYDTKSSVGTAITAYQYDFTEDVSLVASSETNGGMMFGVSLFVTPKTKEDLFCMLMAYGAIMATLNPELSEDQRGELLQELYIMPDKFLQLKNVTRKVIRGNVRYITRFVPEYATFMLTAEAKDL